MEDFDKFGTNWVMVRFPEMSPDAAIGFPAGETIPERVTTLSELYIGERPFFWVVQRWLPTYADVRTTLKEGWPPESYYRMKNDAWNGARMLLFLGWPWRGQGGGTGALVAEAWVTRGPEKPEGGRDIRVWGGDSQKRLKELGYKPKVLTPRAPRPSRATRRAPSSTSGVGWIPPGPSRRS